MLATHHPTVRLSGLQLHRDIYTVIQKADPYENNFNKYWPI